MEFVFENEKIIAKQNGEVIGKLYISSAGDEIDIIESVVVESSHRGKGVGTKLIEFLVNKDRELNKKIVPLCPFSKATFERHPEFNDVKK